MRSLKVVLDCCNKNYLKYKGIIKKTSAAAKYLLNILENILIKLCIVNIKAL